MEKDYYYVLTHSGKRLGSTVKEARDMLKVGGPAIKALFRYGAIKRIDMPKVNSYEYNEGV